MNNLEKVRNLVNEYVAEHGTDTEILDLSEGIILRREDLKEGVAFELSGMPVNISTKERNVLVDFQELLICGISVEDEGYWIFNASSEWADKTTYLCEEVTDGTWKYYLETIDECIGEAKRLVMFETQKNRAPKQGVGTREVILDADAGVEYGSIYEIINATAGTKYTGWMKACWPSGDGNGNFRIWCPKLAKIKNGYPVTNASGCVNYMADNGNQIIYDDLNERDVEGGPQYRNYDLIFAKEYNGPYLFRGVFKRDDAKCRLNHHVSTRVAKRVKVIGCPADRIEILE